MEGGEGGRETATATATATLRWMGVPEDDVSMVEGTFEET